MQCEHVVRKARAQPVSQTEGQEGREADAMGRGWRNDSVPGPIYLLLAAGKDPNFTQRRSETPHITSQNLILLVLSTAGVRICLCILNCEGGRLSCPMTPKMGPLSHTTAC